VLALETGARFNTVRTLQWRRVDFAGRCLKWGKDKTPSGTGEVKASAPQVLWLEDRPPFQRFIKRAMDIVGSILAITFSLPLLIVIAVAIKLTSRGPLLFRQQRLGYHGQKFVFLKFRSMYMNYDPKIHQEYVKRIISGGVKKGSKMENDPRITPVGRPIFERTLRPDEPRWPSASVDI